MIRLLLTEYHFDQELLPLRLSFFIPTSNETLVLVDGFSKIIAKIFFFQANLAIVFLIYGYDKQFHECLSWTVHLNLKNV